MTGLIDAQLGVVADFIDTEPASPDVYPCSHCEQPIEGVPLTDAEQVAIFGYEAALKWCDEDCFLENAAAHAEANAT